MKHLALFVTLIITSFSTIAQKRGAATLFNVYPANIKFENEVNIGSFIPNGAFVIFDDEPENKYWLRIDMCMTPEMKNQKKYNRYKRKKGV